MSLQDRTYGEEFSVLERKLLFNPKYGNMGYVKHINPNGKYFYLHPSPYKSIDNVIFFAESCERPEQDIWVEVEVTSEKKLFDASSDRYVTFKHISGWKPFDPRPLLEHGKLLDPAQFKFFFEYPFKGDRDSIEQLGVCCSLYALSSPPTVQVIGGVNTAVLGKKYLWDHFQKAMKVIPSEFYKTSSRYFYIISEWEKRVPKCSSEEISRAIYYPQETAVHIPVVIENVSLKWNAREFQQYFEEEKRLITPYIIESLFLKPKTENVEEKIVDAVHEMRAHYEKKGRAPYTQNFGDAAAMLSASAARLNSHEKVRSADVDNTVDLWKEMYNRAIYIFGSPLSPRQRSYYTSDTNQLYDELYGAFGLDSWDPISEALKVTKLDHIDFELALESLRIWGHVVILNSKIQVIKRDNQV